MSGKVLRILIPIALLLGGCATPAPQPAPATPPPKTATAPPTRPSAPAVRTPPQNTTHSTSPRPRPTPPPSPQPGVADTLATAVISKPGAPTAPPVPLFRQAIVLANVRAAVADLPAPPQAEFRQGLLTLRFGEAKPDQVATAVSRAMSVPEVNRVQVVTTP